MLRWSSTVLAVALSVQVALAWEIPLEVKEGRGKAGPRFVTSGVPLLPGQAKDISRLRLESRDAEGRPTDVSAQFRELARWVHRDNSLRWVLVDFQVVLNANETRVFVLTDRPPTSSAVAASPRPLAVRQTDDEITIDTSAATFVVPRKDFTFLKSVAIDGEELLDPGANQGLVLEDTLGNKYYSSAGTKSVEVIESGPLRVRVRARGLNTARDGKGYSRGMYQFDVMMDFFAGSAAVYSDVVIGNNFAKPVGTPTFKDASLVLKLKTALPGLTSCTIVGDKPHNVKLSPGQSARLYQDSNGADTWESCQGYNTERRDYWRFPKGLTASFRGYQLLLRAATVEDSQALAKGNFARGTTQLAGANGGMVVHMLNFWQQFPKAMEVGSDGRIRVGLFPGEYKVPHFLEDATAKGHEIWFQFHGKGQPAPDAAALAGVWDSRAMARVANLAHTAACGALADLGPFTVPTRGLDSRPSNRTAAYDSRMLTDDGLYGNAYGWQVFGERWRSCGGHSSRGARQPMNEDDYLNRWFVTGEYAWFLAGDARSRHFRDVRSYRIEDQDPFGFAGWKEFSANNRSEDWAKRAMPDDEECQKYSQGRYPRSTFWLPNPEHSVLDLPYDRYLLLGDQRSFENLPIIAAHGGYFARPKVSRDTGWSLRTLFRYWDLTGDPKAGKLLTESIAVYRKMIDQPIALPMVPRKVKTTDADGQAKEETVTTVNWWFSFVFGRAMAMVALHTRDRDALEVCKRLAAALDEAAQKHTGHFAGDFAELYAVLYHLTGEQKYQLQALGKDNGESLLRVSGGMKSPACAHWLATQPPSPMK